METLTDNFEKKIQNAFVNGFLSILIKLIRPIATLTEIFFRKQIGERYLTAWNLVAGLGLIAFAATPMWVNDYNFEKAAYIIAAIWGLGLFVHFILHTREVAKRYQNNQRWHSYNYGLPRYEIIHESLEKIIPIAIGILAIFLHFFGLGLLLIASGVISLQLRYYEKRDFQNRLLDAIDAEIANDNFAKAINDRLPPEQTEGYRAHPNRNMPEGFTKKFVSIKE